MVARDEIAEQELIQQSRDQRNFFEALYGRDLYPWQRNVIETLTKNQGRIIFYHSAQAKAITEAGIEMLGKTLKQIPKDKP